MCKHTYVWMAHDFFFTIPFKTPSKSSYSSSKSWNPIHPGPQPAFLAPKAKYAWGIPPMTSFMEGAGGWLVFHCLPSMGEDCGDPSSWPLLVDHHSGSQPTAADRLPVWRSTGGGEGIEQCTTVSFPSLLLPTWLLRGHQWVVVVVEGPKQQ